VALDGFPGGPRGVDADDAAAVRGGVQDVHAQVVRDVHDATGLELAAGPDEGVPVSPFPARPFRLGDWGTGGPGVIRGGFPLSAFRFPLSAFRSPLSTLRFHGADEEDLGGCAGGLAADESCRANACLVEHERVAGRDHVGELVEAVVADGGVVTLHTQQAGLVAAVGGALGDASFGEDVFVVGGPGALHVVELFERDGASPVREGPVRRAPAGPASCSATVPEAGGLDRLAGDEESRDGAAAREDLELARIGLGDGAVVGDIDQG